MKKIKEKVESIIEKGNSRIEEINKSIQRVKETSMYSNEHKLQVEAEKKQECLQIRNEVSDQVNKLFDEEIERVNGENYYKNIDNSETSNILKMIELSKDTMGKEEVEYLLRMYDSNNVIKRVLASIAESKDMRISGIKYLPNSIELENIKQQLSGAILSTDTTGITSLKLELLLKSIS